MVPQAGEAQSCLMAQLRQVLSELDSASPSHAARGGREDLGPSKSGSTEVAEQSPLPEASASKSVIREGCAARSLSLSQMSSFSGAQSKAWVQVLFSLPARPPLWTWQ